MFDALLIGLAAGYAIAIPVGPIALLIIRTAMHGGLRPGLAAGAGTATVDFLYAAVAMLAGPVLVTAIAPILFPARVGAALVLMFFALAATRRAGARAVATEPASTLRTYLVFVGLTIVNPATVIYFAALAVGLPAVSADPLARAAFVVAAATASLSWQWLLAGTASLFHGQIPARAERWAARVSAVIILALALRILADAFAQR